MVRRVEVRRTPDGALDVPLADVLANADGRVVLDVRNDPGEPDFDGREARTARLLVEALPPGADVTVASADWFSIEVARDAGLRTAFVTPEGVALEAAVAYAADAGHAECHPHPSAVLEDPAALDRARALGIDVVLDDD